MNLTLLWHFVRQDFIDRYSGIALGRFWLLLAPMLQIIIFVVVFGGLIGPRLPGAENSPYGYGIYLVSGILPWTAFANTITRMTTVFFNKRGILGKVPLSLAMVAAHVAIVEGITLACTLGLFTIFALWLAEPLPSALFVLPLLIVCQQLMGFTLGLIGAILMVFLLDIREMTGVVVMLWFWMVPIVYTIDSVPHSLQAIQPYNPAWWFVREYHQIFAYGAMPDLGGILLLLAGSLIAAWLIVLLLSRAERQIRDAL